MIFYVPMQSLPMQNEMTFNMNSNSVIYDDYDDYVSGAGGYPPPPQQYGGDGLYTGEIRLGTIAQPDVPLLETRKHDSCRLREKAADY